MRVLVTGGQGFLGRHFVNWHLSKRDHVVVVDDLSAGQPPVSFTGDVLIEVIDCLDYFRHAHENFDVAYHFAAPVGGRLKIDGDPLFNAHSLALDSAFFRWAVSHVKRAVYPSSSAVYGVALQGERASMQLQEGMFHPSNPNWYAPDQMYGFTKMAGEMLAWKAAEYGLETLCIRPFSGYGEGQSFDYPVPAIAARVLKREDPLEIWGSGHQTRDFIHVDDLVRITMERMAYGMRERYDTLNLGSGWATSFYDLAHILARLEGYEPTITTDASKPEGVFKRWASTSRMARFGEPEIDITRGMQRVLDDVRQRLGTATIRT